MFLFNSSDCRYDSAETMLCAILAQVCRQCQGQESRKIVRESLAFLDICHSRRLEDLYSVLIDILIQLIELKRGGASPHSVILVIGNLDGKVRNGVWLFQRLQETISDCNLKLKVVVTTSEPDSLTSDLGSVTGTFGAMGNILATPSGRSSKKDAPITEDKTEGICSPVDKDILVLIQKRPELYVFASDLHQIGSVCGHDRELWRTITNFLQDTQLPKGAEDIKCLLAQFSEPDMAPSKAFKAILASGLSQPRPWSTSLTLGRVLFAFRPLTVSEVLDLELFNPHPSPIAPESAKSPPSPHRAGSKGVAEWPGGGLLTTKHHEVHFAHPALRDYLMTCEDDNILDGRLPLRSESPAIHQSMAETCLSYLACPEKRQLMRDRADRNPANRWHTPFQRWDDFLSYAVQYWLRHAMCATKLDGPSFWDSEICKRFLDDDEAVGPWATLYLDMSPIPTGEEEIQYADELASLVIFSEHEAAELLTSALNKHQKLKTKGLTSACFDALVVAAGKGNLAIVKELMGICLHHEGRMLDLAIVAAIESGSQEVFDEMLSVAKKTPRKIQNWIRLLTRAASLNFTEALKALLAVMQELGISTDVPKGAVSPLSYACQRGFPDVIHLLCQGGLSEPEWVSFSLAVKSGRLGDMRSLFSWLQKDPEDLTVVLSYCQIFSDSNRYGRRNPVREALRDMRERLANAPRSEEDTESGGDSGSREGAGETDKLLDYITAKLIGDTHSFEGYGYLVAAAISKWPRALDLIDLLTQPSSKVEEDLVRTTWATWMERAVDSGELKVIKLVFENVEKSPLATPEATASTATSTLNHAIFQSDRGASDLVPYFMEKGADLKERNYRGRTPLYQAAYWGREEAIKALLKYKDQLDIEAADDQSWRPIHACYDNPTIARMLAEAGANLNAFTSDGEPPLHFAVKWDYTGTVDELLKWPLSRDTLKAGLKTAILEGRISLAEKLLQYCPDGSYLPEMNDLLHRQVRGSKSNLKLLETLLGEQYGVDVDRRDDDDNTALHCVTSDTPVELVELLVRHKADVEATNGARATPLIIAIVHGNVDVVRCLVQEGNARLNVTHWYCGPLNAACRLGTLEMVKIMHQRKTDPVDVDRIDPGNQETPLQSALVRLLKTEEKDAIIHYLLEEAHADINITSPFWYGALHVACLNSTPEIMQLLIDKGDALGVDFPDRVGRTPLHFSLYRSPEHINVLLKYNPDWTAVDAIRRNAMHFAVLSGRLDVVKLVMEKWQEYVEQEDPSGWSDDKMAEFVVCIPRPVPNPTSPRSGSCTDADVSKPQDQNDDHGWTPLLWALRGPSIWGGGTETKEIIQELLRLGARKLVRGQGVDRTWTPMKLAKYYQVKEDIVKLLKPTKADLEKMSAEDREWGWGDTGTKQGTDKGDIEAYCDHCMLVRLSPSLYLGMKLAANFRTRTVTSRLVL